MPEIEGLVGPSNWLRSGLVDWARSINLRTERATPGNPKAPSWLGCTPGLRHVITIGPDPVECLFWVIGRVFGVSGTNFFELMADETVVSRGTVAHDGIDVATMASGGTFSDSVLIIAGSHAYVFKLSTNVFTEQPMPEGSDIDPNGGPITPSMCEFFAGYFLVLVRGSRTVFWSTLENATSWPKQNFFSVSWAADPISFIKRVGTHVWVVGQQTAQIWYATGDITIFAPVQETLIEHGCIAPFSGQRLGENTLCWLDRNESGGGLVVVASGITPNTISTYSVAWQQEKLAEIDQPSLYESIGVPMQIAGHLDYALLNRAPQAIANTTPVFDFTEGLWHERATWNADLSQWQQWRIMSHVYAFEKHYGGDYRTGAIYQISSGFFDEELVEVADVVAPARKVA